MKTFVSKQNDLDKVRNPVLKKDFKIVPKKAFEKNENESIPTESQVKSQNTHHAKNIENSKKQSETQPSFKNYIEKSEIPSVSPISNETLYNTLKELAIIDEKTLDTCFIESKESKIPLDEVLFKKDLVHDAILGQIIGDVIGLPYINLAEVSIPPSLSYLIPEDFAKQHKIIAFGQTAEEIKIALVHPIQNQGMVKMIQQKADKKISFYYTTQREFEKSLKVYKQNLQRSYDEVLKEQVKVLGQQGVSEAPIEKIVDILIEYAYDNDASDIHLEPQKSKSIVRFRIDGVLHEVLHFSIDIHEQVISRIKFLSKLRTDEHLSAQDGKIQMKIENEELDIRVSIVPIVHGEKCVLRLLSARYRQFGLLDLGMSETDLAKVKEAFAKPYGMILSTGPTGSGKTTSMYAILKILNTKERNIATIEDPVEYEVEGLNQIQVNPKTNLTFAEGLRSILRQDPNVMYVGEIRDDETADIAVNSAMTGHLVLSTLHTNNAATALPRLLDMNIEPFLVATTVNVVIAQRLVRKICEKCKTSQPIPRTELEKKFDKNYVTKYFKNAKETRCYLGKGCLVCKGTGYAGRVGIFEVLSLSEKIKDLIVTKADSQKIIKQAISEGMTTMTEDGLFKVHEGITTIEEVLRATRE